MTVPLSLILIVVAVTMFVMAMLSADRKWNLSIALALIAAAFIGAAIEGLNLL